MVPNMAEVPQMALDTVPPAILTAGIPQIAEVLTGIAGRTTAMFMLSRSIGLISDGCLLFMSFAWFFISFPFYWSLSTTRVLV